MPSTPIGLLLLTLLPLLPASCLQVSPNRSQFFQYESISLSCEGQLNATGWKVKRRTKEGGVRPCSSGWGYYSSGSTCTIRNTYPADTGEYWCESERGEQSPGINITITDGAVILESPPLPVTEGTDVILRCKTTSEPSNLMYNFFKDGHLVRSSSSGGMTIQRASIVDGGLYSCNVSGYGESAGSWLTVTGSLAASSAAQPTVSGPFLVFRVLCHVVVGTPYVLSSILLALIYRDRKKATLTVTPDRSQFFRYENISLRCGDSSWTLKRNTSYRTAQESQQGWALPRGDAWLIETAYPSDSGVYWCESQQGECSNAVNITVTAKVVILEIPPHPVNEGDDVTLHCSYKEEEEEKSTSKFSTNFYRDNVFIGKEDTGKMSLKSLSRAKEGFYRCQHPSHGKSEESWLPVKSASVSHNELQSTAVSPTPSTTFNRWSRLISGVLLFALYTVVLILAVYTYRKLVRARADARSC
ncbi:Fc receptor-like protein 5 [Cololabis saira]|uniref:Fc receptor-like protein 5 n=1 Tax=Cololabis saira TaxID=129043 RepID=UPI002AD4BC8F|nr:Fc receptor-like protein 5 [Cololabis saira]